MKLLPNNLVELTAADLRFCESGMDCRECGGWGMVEMDDEKSEVKDGRA